MKPMPYRKLAKLLTDLGCTCRPGKGSHEVWSCCPHHSTPVVRGEEASPGVLRQAIQRLICLPKGWLK